MFAALGRAMIDSSAGSGTASGGDVGGGWTPAPVISAPTVAIVPTVLDVSPPATIVQLPGPPSPIIDGGGGDIAPSPASSIGISPYLASQSGPYGDGEYVPLDYPAMKFLGKGDSLRDGAGASAPGGSNALLWLGLGLGLLLLLKK